MNYNLNRQASAQANNLRDLLDQDIEMLQSNPTAENIYRVHEKIRQFARAALISPDDLAFYSRQIPRSN